MGEIGEAGRAGTGDLNIRSRRRYIFAREFAVDKVLLHLLYRLGFSHTTGQMGVELLHPKAGAGIVDLPEGSNYSFGSPLQEGVADARNFDAVLFAPIAQGRFAGGQHDQMHPGQSIQPLNVGDFERIAIAQHQKGLLDRAGDKFAVGGEVQDLMLLQPGLQAGLGEGLIEELIAGKDAVGIVGGFNNGS